MVVGRVSAFTRRLMDSKALRLGKLLRLIVPLDDAPKSGPERQGGGNTPTRTAADGADDRRRATGARYAGPGRKV